MTEKGARCWREEIAARRCWLSEGPDRTKSNARRTRGRRDETRWRRRRVCRGEEEEWERKRGLSGRWRWKRGRRVRASLGRVVVESADHQQNNAGIAGFAAFAASVCRSEGVERASMDLSHALYASRREKWACQDVKAVIVDVPGPVATMATSLLRLDPSDQSPVIQITSSGLVASHFANCFSRHCTFIWRTLKLLLCLSTAA